MLTIVPVVEGDGDAAALPELLVRILQNKYNRYDVFVAQGKTRVVKANGRPNLEKKLDKFLRHAQNKPGCGAILILVDADVDCPVDLAMQLSQRRDEIGTRCPVQIVCARRSYESWFLASLNSVKGWHGISSTSTLSSRAEDVPDRNDGSATKCPGARLTKRQSTKHPLAD